MIKNMGMISKAIQESQELKKSVEQSFFDEYEDLKAIGVVEQIDQHFKRVMIDGEWFKVSEIMGVRENL